MRKLLLLVFTLCLTMGTYAQEKLTLDKAISIALNKNTTLIKTVNNLKTSEIQKTSAYMDLLPSLGTSASWNWTKTQDEGSQQVNFLGDLVDQPASEVDTRNYSVSAGGNITLFDGLANWASISQSGDNFDAAVLSYKRLKRNIVLQTEVYYFNVLNTRELLKVREDNVAYNKKNLETIQERNRLGSIPIADVYAQQVQLGNAELALVQAQNNYENAVSTLLDYLSVDVLEEYEFEDPYGKQNDTQWKDDIEDFSSIGNLVNEAMQNRLDYQSQLKVVESAESGVTIARGSYFPSLSGSYSYSTSATDPGDLFKREVFSAGLTLSLSIFNNWNRETAVQSAEVQLMNSKEDLKELERQIKIEVKQGYLDLQAAIKQLEVSTNNVKAAEENRKISNERYSLGAGTILDVLQADRDYTTAIQNRIDALYNFYSAKASLSNRLGKLDFSSYEN